MRFSFKCYFLLFIFLFFPFKHISAQESEIITGRVVAVYDGDTVTVLTPLKEEIKIRLAEIDAPEKNQPFGQKSKQMLSDLVFDKEVIVLKQDTDRYGRTVGKIFINANHRMVEQGGAWAYRQYLEDVNLLNVEQQARENQTGLWALQTDQVIPPWEWRKGARDKAEQKKSASVIVPGQTLRKKAENPSNKTYIAPVSETKESPDNAQSCGSKKYCKQMKNCAEAHFYLTHCGRKKLDKDSDGIPCESLCK